MGNLEDSNKTTSLDESVVVIADGLGSGVNAGVTTANRLKVDAQITTTSQDNFIYTCGEFLNAGSSLMNVNGSVTPVNFQVTPGVGETLYLERIRLMLLDGGTMTATNFGSIAALTNGFRLQIKSKGTTYDILNLKNNSQVSTYMQVTLSPTAAGFIDVTDAVWAELNFKNPIVLQNSTSDFLQWTVRDNLTSIDQLRSAAWMFKTI